MFMNTTRVLYIGDVVGKGGRSAVRELLPNLRDELKLDAVFLNAENIAHGRGITPSAIEEMEQAGVDWFSSGNHIWDNAKGVEYMKRADAKVLRPANFPDTDPGMGWAEIEIGTKKFLLINLIGQVFMEQEASSPFLMTDSILAERSLSDYTAIIIDIHAEATSEKQALAFHVDGRVSAVVGTHTHVPTADLQTLPQGTGLVCDLGYVGSAQSVLGFAKEHVLDRFLTDSGRSLAPVESGMMNFKSVLLEIDSKTKFPISITRIDREIYV